MAAVGVLCLAKSFSAFNNHASPWNICLRFISRKVLFEKLQLPEKPKKPMAPFLAFSKDVRPKVEKECKELTMTEITKKVGQMWHDLSESEKKRYKDQFQIEFKKYKENLKTFQESLSEEQMNEINQAINEVTATRERALIKKMKLDKIKEFNKPKPPLNPFLKFMTTQDKGNLTAPEFWKKMSSKWKELSDKEKEVYSDEYKLERAKYSKEIEKWESEMLEKGNFDLVRTATIKKRFKHVKE